MIAALLLSIPDAPPWLVWVAGGLGSVAVWRALLGLVL